MADIRNRLLLSISNFDTNLKRAGAAVERFDKKVDRASKILSRVFAIGAVGGAVAAVGRLITSVSNLGDELAKTSQRTGIAVESLNGLRFAAEQSGASSAELSVGLRQLSKNIFDMANGTGEARVAFQLLDVQVKNGDGTLRKTDEVLFELANKLSQYKDGTAKAAIAQKLFGESGAKLIPLLNNGAAGIKKLSDEGNRLAPITAQQARDSEKFNDALNRLGRALQGLLNAAILPLLPALTEMADAMSEIAVEIGPLLKRVMEGIADAFTLAITPAKNMLATMSFVAEGISAVWNGEFQKAGKAYDDLIASIERNNKAGAKALRDLALGRQAEAPQDARNGLGPGKPSDIDPVKIDLLLPANTEEELLRLKAQQIEQLARRDEIEMKGIDIVNAHKMRAIQLTAEADILAAEGNTEKIKVIQMRLANDLKQIRETARADEQEAIGRVLQENALREREFAQQAHLDRMTMLQAEAEASRIRGDNALVQTRNEMALLREEMEHIQQEDIIGPQQEARLKVIQAEMDNLNRRVIVLGQDIRSNLKDSFKGFMQEVRRGENVWESLENAMARFFDSLQEKMLEAATNEVFNKLFSGSAGGLGGGGGAGGGGLGGGGGGGLFSSLGGLFSGGGSPSSTMGPTADGAFFAGLGESAGSGGGGLFSAFGFNKGGMVPGVRVLRFAPGGMVPGMGNSDTVPALLTPEEGVLSKAGMRNLEKLNNGSGLKGDARPVNVHVTIQTPDLGSFVRNRGVVAAQMASTLRRAERKNT